MWIRKQGQDGESSEAEAGCHHWGQKIGPRLDVTTMEKIISIVSSDVAEGMVRNFLLRSRSLRPKHSAEKNTMKALFAVSCTYFLLEGRLPLKGCLFSVKLWNTTDAASFSFVRCCRWEASTLRFCLCASGTLTHTRSHGIGYLCCRESGHFMYRQFVFFCVLPVHWTTWLFCCPGPFTGKRGATG